MFATRAVIVGLVLCMGSFAFAQDDDDLPALPTGKAKPPVVAKPKPKPAPAAAKPKPKPKPPPVDEDLPPLIASSAAVQIKLSAPVKGAKLFIDDREIGTMPQPAQTLSNGEHTVTIRRLGYTTWSKPVKVSGKPLEVAIALEATAGVLSVSSDVAGAEVYVNGRPAGTTPLADVEVPAGNIEISVKKEGYRDGNQTVSVKAGRDYPVEVKLGAPVVAAVAAQSDKPLNTDLNPMAVSTTQDFSTPRSVDSDDPVYKKWWFWTAVAAGVAVVATAASVTAYEVSPNPRLSLVQVCGGGGCSKSADQMPACINCPTAAH